MCAFINKMKPSEVTIVPHAESCREMLHLFVMVILKLVNVQYISSSATGLSIRAKQTMFAEN